MANIKKYNFSTKFRGYDPKEVNNELNDLLSQIDSLNERNNSLQKDNENCKDQIRTLAHQNQMHEGKNEEIARLALKEASELIEKAKRNANLILKESLDYVRTLGGEVEGFKEQAISFRFNVQKMSQDLLDSIDNSEVYYLIKEDQQQSMAVKLDTVVDAKENKQNQ
jgi:Cell division initiation protein